ncbi:hypothetical protein [Streptomyces sp. NPDC057682]|uniref:hypothetical protein n=1 Tax=Streptomyces sp. NPDC057682 TaxID=3346210 RepID=UPI0036A07C1C
MDAVDQPGDVMKRTEGIASCLRGGGFLRGSALGLAEMFLGWRTLFLGFGGTLVGFVGAITNEGAATRVTLVVIGCVSLALLVVTLKYVKSDRSRHTGA